jgi:hypothetical protein
LPVESRMALEAVAGDRIHGGPIRSDAEAQATVTIKPAIGRPAPREMPCCEGIGIMTFGASPRHGRDVGFQGLGGHGPKAKDGCDRDLRSRGERLNAF